MDQTAIDRCRELFSELLHKARYGAVPKEVCIAKAARVHDVVSAEWERVTKANNKPVGSEPRLGRDCQVRLSVIKTATWVVGLSKRLIYESGA